MFKETKGVVMLSPLSQAVDCEPIISVIVPLYNKESTVLCTIQSVLCQTFPRFELIVVDDGSTDAGPALVSRLADARIRIIRQENQGVSAARNNGIQESNAALVAFLDADDWWEPNFLDAIVALWNLYPDAGILATGQRHYMGPECTVETSVRLPPNMGTGLVNYAVAIQEGAFIWPSNVAVPKHVFAAVGVFPVGEAIGEDLDFWARVALRYPIACDQRVLAVYNVVDGGQASQMTSRQPSYPPVVRTLRRLLDTGAVPSEAIERATTMLEFYTLDHLYTMVEAGLRSEVQAALRRERFHTPRFAVEAKVLRLGAYLLPLRAIVLLKHQHRWLPTPLDRRPVVHGKALIHRRFMDSVKPLPYRRDRS